MKARVLVERWHRGESVVVKWGEVDDGSAQHFVNMEERRERDKVSALLAPQLEKNDGALGGAHGAGAMTTIVVTPGRCRVCGCSDLDPCISPGGTGAPVTRCVWADFDHTLCSNLRCIALVPLDELIEMPIFRGIDGD